MSVNPQETARRAAECCLCDILAQIAAALRADAAIAPPGVEVVTEDDGDIDTEIARVLGAMGLCITVMLVAARSSKPNLPGPVFGEVSYLVEIVENAVMNRSAGGRTALEEAELAARLLHQLSLADGRRLQVADIVKAPRLPAPATNGYQIPLTIPNVSINRKAE
ncbi:MAG TPA: hypothetical protein PLN93_10990 [Vicinamibacterales bacterium]|nr:hypothetical protein [Vicinamibacterales bacterium]